MTFLPQMMTAPSAPVILICVMVISAIIVYNVTTLGAKVAAWWQQAKPAVVRIVSDIGKTVPTEVLAARVLLTTFTVVRVLMIGYPYVAVMSAAVVFIFAHRVDDVANACVLVAQMLPIGLFSSHWPWLVIFMACVAASGLVKAFTNQEALGMLATIGSCSVCLSQYCATADPHWDIVAIMAVTAVSELTVSLLRTVAVGITTFRTVGESEKLNKERRVPQRIDVTLASQ